MHTTELERNLLDLDAATLRRVCIGTLRNLSVAARETYDFDGDGVVDPVRLREFNEAVHRIAGALEHCEDGRASAAVDILAGQCADEADPVSQAVRRGLEQALAAAAGFTKEQT